MTNTDEKTEIPRDFETAMRRLDALLRKLDEGNLPLENLLKDYEEGNRLIHYCRAQLEGFEKRIEILNRDDGAAGEWRDFAESAPRTGDTL